MYCCCATSAWKKGWGMKEGRWEVVWVSFPTSPSIVHTWPKESIPSTNSEKHGKLLLWRNACIESMCKNVLPRQLLSRKDRLRQDPVRKTSITVLQDTTESRFREEHGWDETDLRSFKPVRRGRAFITCTNHIQNHEKIRQKCSALVSALGRTPWEHLLSKFCWKQLFQWKQRELVSELPPRSRSVSPWAY